MQPPQATSDPPGFNWTEGDLFTHTLLVLVENTEHVALQALDTDVFILASDTKTFVVLRYHEAAAAKIEDRVRRLLSHPAQGSLEIALLGGDQEARSLLEKTPPRSGALTILHVPFSQTGTPEASVRVLGHGRSTLSTALETARQRLTQPIDEAAARKAILAARDTFVQNQQEQQQFAKRLDANKPHATHAILALIGVCFVFQLTVGATGDASVLVQYGALYGPAISEGQWWRLASCTLLHDGFMHVAFNSYVLFALGNFVERLLGSVRFVLLYVVTGVVASLGSLLFIGGVSVGASGAIWGLLGAEAVLAFGQNTLLTPSIKRSLKRATIVNLALNSAASFLPHVDWAAHFAGGAAGAALIASGLLLPRTQTLARPSAQLQLAATALSLTFFGAALYGVLVAGTGSNL